jgi:hypothetical protein
MTAVLISFAVLIVLILIALKMGLNRKEVINDEEPRTPVIHMSGIYSIVRKSPRQDLTALRPTEGEIREYLANVTEDANGAPLSASDRAALLKHWKAYTEANLLEIESGDKSGIAFYYYDYPAKCPLCAPFITKGNFVTREEIYNNPQIIPPFHLGCECTITAHQGSDAKVRDTVAVGMLPFFTGDKPPQLPEWTGIVLLSSEAKG